MDVRELPELLYAHGFSLRKGRLLRTFAGTREIRFVSSGRQVPAGGALLLWGQAPVPAGTPNDAQLVRVEDGFLRSVGLGADLVRPVSWVFDRTGLYYDARSPSDLERILQQAELHSAELMRARHLREVIVTTGLTKYNLTSASSWNRPAGAARVVLVVGQVETDAAIQSGALRVRTNLSLLRAVRAARPDAWVVYKPHPDVVAGLRDAGRGEHEARRYCDEVLVDQPSHTLYPLVDEVHVMTSLAGFEALLRGVAVTCWGHPFYAGWGLTTDAEPHPRRTRRLTLDALVACALLRYPTYCSLQTGLHCTAEDALQELLRLRHLTGGRMPWWRRALRPLIARR